MNRTFIDRHIGPSAEETAAMLQFLGLSSLDELIDKVVPDKIRSPKVALSGVAELPAGLDELEVLNELKAHLSGNKVKRSLIGLGYYGTFTPPVILRNILENPGWYTQYTPYQAEIAQGRLEALLNYQTMVAELTGLDVANASLLDEGTAAAEAVILAHRRSDSRNLVLVDRQCHPQTLSCIETRATPLGISVKPLEELRAEAFAVVLQYPGSEGVVTDYSALAEQARSLGITVICATDLLALTMLKPPGEWGADIAVGSSQRFGVPLGFGGPHAAFFAVIDDLKRLMPGRLIGVSKDRFGERGLRLSLQTREQHIRRDKATSNICTAQVLLAVISSMYALYHGPKGLKAIAQRVNSLAGRFASALLQSGGKLRHQTFFDTVTIELSGERRQAVLARLSQAGINIRTTDRASLSLSFDELSTESELNTLLKCFGATDCFGVNGGSAPTFPESLLRKSSYLEHQTFNSYHSEHELLRYIHRLQSKDLSLTTSMIPLGSCTMKLNATVEMIPVTWPEVGAIHPFAPAEQTVGYKKLADSLCQMLAEITGLPGVSLQPNSGSQGEYAGLLVVRAYHEARGESHRDICLIPDSAHGTNPASAVMAGYRVVPVRCDEMGDVDLEDFRLKAKEHAEKLACAMITYPSTHGVFEDTVTELCEIVHSHGGQVYMDGANMNAQVGVCRPGDFGIDLCHLNLHKTFCIPHGGGGPGVGPICAATHLAPYLPGHPLSAETGGESAIGPVAAAPLGSASILPISWVYIRLMGEQGLKKATQIAILNANYISKKLEPFYPTLYRGKLGFVAHECILDLREFKRTAGVEVEDVAKRLMDYGFHAPTVSWPVAGTLMVEPTESESKAELDRFCEAMIAIRKEIDAVASGALSREDNPLKMAPHTAREVTATEWTHPYSREQAAYPLPYLRQHKFWPAVARIDSVYGDRNLFCACS
jgi:glycine dehydrogenase